MGCVCMCVCMSGGVYHVFAGTFEGQKRASDSMELELQALVSHLTWVLKPKLGPLEKQFLILTTEPVLILCKTRSGFIYLFCFRLLYFCHYRLMIFFSDHFWEMSAIFLTMCLVLVLFWNPSCTYNEVWILCCKSVALLVSLHLYFLASHSSNFAI